MIETETWWFYNALPAELILLGDFNEVCCTSTLPPEISEVLSHSEKNYDITTRSSRPELYCEKGVLKTFAIFTGKRLCWVWTTCFCLGTTFTNTQVMHLRDSLVLWRSNSSPCNFVKNGVWRRCLQDSW